MDKECDRVHPNSSLYFTHTENTEHTRHITLLYSTHTEYTRHITLLDLDACTISTSRAIGKRIIRGGAL